MFMRRFVSGAVVALAAIAALAAQQAPPTPPDQPAVTFKVAINYVEVDASVFDRDGQFVPNLKKEDFEVLEDGVRQDITAFTQVNIPIERPEPPPLQAKTVIEPDVVSNVRPFEGRVYVIILDDKHTLALRSQLVKRAATQFISQYMAANDMAAVITTGGQLQSTQEFTSNKRLLLRAVNNFMGQKIRSETEERLDEYARQSSVPSGPGRTVTGVDDPRDMERGYDARMALETIAKISDWVGSIRGRRKAIVWFSEGIDYDIYNFQKREASTITEKMKDVIASATRSDVSIYSIDPRGLTSLADESINVSGGFPNDPMLNLSMQSFQDSLRRSQDSLRSLSEETGGFAAVNSNDFTNAFTRVVKDNSGYYVLGYYPKDERRDGRFRRIQVKVNRQGLEVRSRRGYTAPRGKAPAERKAVAGDQTSAEVRDALDSPLPLSGLRLHAFAAPFKGTAPNTDVTITVEAEGRSFGFVEKEGKFFSDLEVSTIAVDYQGKIRGGDRNFVNFALKPENRRDVRRHRRAHGHTAPPAAGPLPDSRRRQGRRDGPRRHDQLRHRRARLHAGPADDERHRAHGGVGPAHVHREAGRGAESGACRHRRSPSRDFPKGDEMALFAEVYDNDVKTPHTVDITSTVVAEDGKTVFTAHEERQSSDLQGKPGGYGHTARFSTTDFAPGTYVLTVEARSRAGKTPATTSRSVQFRIRG